MKILLVHNQYGRFSGEEAVFYAAGDLLRERGHEVATFVRSSASLSPGLPSHARAFFSGIWSVKARREFRETCEQFRPDLVQLQNLFPLISASVIGVVAERRLPLVFSAHNYRLFCPTGLMLRAGKACELCARGREWNAVRHNCEGSLPRSFGYAVRNRVALKRLLKHVHCFTVLSHFQRAKFEGWGVPKEKLAVVPNSVSAAAWPSMSWTESRGIIGYVGRMSIEKGVGVLLAAARILPEYRFEFAGHHERMPEVETLSSNVVLHGEMSQADLPLFYGRTRMIVVPSTCYEAFGLSAVEAMLCGRPVIASRTGGLTDIVEDGRTGAHVEPSNVSDLAEKIRYLYEHPELCRKYGAAGRVKAMSEYTSDNYYNRLMAAYEQACRNASIAYPR